MTCTFCQKPGKATAIEIGQEVLCWPCLYEAAATFRRVQNYLQRKQENKKSPQDEKVNDMLQQIEVIP